MGIKSDKKKKSEPVIEENISIMKKDIFNKKSKEKELCNEESGKNLLGKNTPMKKHVEDNSEAITKPNLSKKSDEDKTSIKNSTDGSDSDSSIKEITSEKSNSKSKKKKKRQKEIKKEKISQEKSRK